MITVRPATHSDIQGIAALEERVWRDQGTAIFGPEYFEAWLEVHPEGFLVAEVDGHIVGDIYFFCTEFDPFHWEPILPYEEGTSSATSRGVHVSGGKSAYIINITSDHPGAGGALMRAANSWVVSRHMTCAYGCIRVPGLSAFLQILRADACRADEKQIAAWYMKETARLVDAHISKTFLPSQPKTALPRLQVPDPSLGRLLRTPGWSLWSCLNNYMEDAPSLNYAGLSVYLNPNMYGVSNE